jgi:two-component system, NtrC family, C4-dicarboxylate transport sensor histidine kinase DctB
MPARPDIAAATAPARRRKPWLGSALALLLITAVAWAAHGLALRSGLERLREGARLRLEVVAARLDGELARFDYLPSLLEMTPSVFDLLESPADAALRELVNRYLHDMNATVGADILYVLDRAGTALASSDAGQPGTPVGQDLSFRPYVRNALAMGRGRFYGVGITSGRAGYYLSYALVRQGQQRGVATVKVSLEAAERDWSQLPGEVMVADERNVVILASREGWKLRPLAPLSAQALADAATSRSYGASALVPLDWQQREALAEQTTRVSLERTRYLATERPVNQNRWRLMLLDDEAPARTTARYAAISAALGTAVLLLLATVLRQRQRALRQQLANRQALQAAHDTLEAKVVERTAELRSLQNELIHAGKLAALGQMSAGMVHELNQPLAAMRTLSDNAVVLLDKQRPDDVRANLSRIGQLVERLARLTQQLKVFAHKSASPACAAGLKQAVQEALFLVSVRVRELAVEVDVQIDPPQLQAAAEPARLEQVLVNLFGNAVDAMAGSALRRLSVHAGRRGTQVVITVADTGPGIHRDVLDHLFEPFVTTKPAGSGLGLGLMISAHIVREFGGTLSAHNREAGGAEFVIELLAG